MAVLLPTTDRTTTATNDGSNDNDNIPVGSRNWVPFLDDKSLTTAEFRNGSKDGKNSKTSKDKKYALIFNADEVWERATTRCIGRRIGRTSYLLGRKKEGEIFGESTIRHFLDGKGIGEKGKGRKGNFLFQR